MNQHQSQLERRLSQLCPRALPRQLEQRIADELEHTSARPKDRFFWSAVAGALVAACIIVGVLAHEPGGPAGVAPLAQRPDDKLSLTTVASADGRWGDELKLASEWRLP